jgi:hypothetical protein
VSLTTTVWRPTHRLLTGNSFYLKFDPTATNGIGHDHSGNGNNFTASGFSTSGTGTDVMSDTPTTNWCTLNPLDFENVSYIPTISEGNLRSSGTSARSLGTIAIPSSGKYYFEGQATTVGTSTAQFGIYAARWGSNGQLNYLNTSGTFTQASIATYSNQTLGIAVNVDDGEVTFYKNNTSVGTTSVSTMAGTLPYFNHGGNWTWTLNFGQRAFAYTPPTGFNALNTANLPAPTIKDGSTAMDVTLYTGITQSPRTITGLSFEPDFVWVKNRTNSSGHYLWDSVRGTDANLRSDGTFTEAAASGAANGIISTNASNGFVVKNGSSSGSNVGSSNSQAYAAWCWDAGGIGSSNTDGSITSTVSANPAAGFSIGTYTADGSNANRTVGHGLGVAPEFIIVKNRDTTGRHWLIWHKGFNDNDKALLFTTAAVADNRFGPSAPTSTVFGLYGGQGNYNSDDHVFYAFAGVEGYSKFGTYTGNGNSNGPFVYCGFKPRWIMIKAIVAGEWQIVDTERSPNNPTQSTQTLEAQDPGAESNFTSRYWNGDILSNGWKYRGVQQYNATNRQYVYMPPSLNIHSAAPVFRPLPPADL